MSPSSDANSQASGGQRISIRPAILNDLPEILNIEQSAPSAGHWSADHYRSRVQDQPQSACFLVAERRDAEAKADVSGFLCARIVAGEWEIENVVVRPAFRGQGIGSMLMQSLIEKWQAAAGTALILEVRESNSAARALYERHGLREVGRRPAYYRDPDETAILYTLKPGSEARNHKP